jgi:hypothetical protein
MRKMSWCAEPCRGKEIVVSSFCSKSLIQRRADHHAHRHGTALILSAMKRYRNTILTILLLAGLGLIFWNKTMSAQLATCEVCVVFNGQRQCSKASGSSAKEATRTAHSTACGPVSNGMNEKIACDSRPPEVLRCDPSSP